MGKVKEKKQYEIFNDQEVRKMLDMISDSFGISREEMEHRKITDNDIAFLFHFIPEQLFGGAIMQLDDQISKLNVYLRENDFLLTVADVFEEELSKLRENLVKNVKLTFPTVGSNKGIEDNSNITSVSMAVFSENMIRSYAKYIFEVNNKIIGIYDLLVKVKPNDFNVERYMSKRRCLVSKKDLVS